MENLPIKVLDIIIDDDCPHELLEPIQQYWELNEVFEFKVKPKQIQDKFNIGTDGMRNIRRYSKLEYDVYCAYCNSYNNQIANSHLQFKRDTPEFENVNDNFRCLACKAKLEDKARKEWEKKERKIEEKKQRQKNKIIKKLESAVDQKAWRDLSPFEFNVLKKCLILENFSELTQLYWNKFQSRDGYKKLFMALKNIAEMDLLLLQYEYDYSVGFNKIVNYQYISKLKEEFEYDLIPKEEQVVKNINKDESTVSSHLKLRLTKYDLNQHPDAPLYAGTIRFKEKIVIDPDVDYTFAQWKRSNDDLYFTLVPTAEIEKLPVQKTLSQEPKILQEHLTNFLNNIEIEK